MMNPRVEQFLKLPFYKRLLIVLLIMATLSGLYVWFLFLPKVEQYKKLVAESQTLQGKISDNQRIAANLPKFKAEYEKMKVRLEQALAELPNEKEIPTLLTSIASLARNNALEVQKFEPGAEVPKGFYAEVPVTMKLSGTFHQVARFFFDVSELERIVNISKVTLGQGKDVAGKTMLSVDCLATTFRFLSQPQGGAPQAAPAAPAAGGQTK